MSFLSAFFPNVGAVSLLVPAVLSGYVFSSRGCVVPIYFVLSARGSLLFLGNVLFSVLNVFSPLPAPPSCFPTFFFGSFLCFFRFFPFLSVSFCFCFPFLFSEKKKKRVCACAGHGLPSASCPCYCRQGLKSRKIATTSCGINILLYDSLF